MSERENILARLAKMKALAERGAAGERDNAARLMESVAAKYGIDLDAVGAEAESDHPVAFSGWKRKLAGQLLDAHRAVRRPERQPLLHVFRRTRSEETPWCNLQFVELMAKHSVLCRDYEEQRKAFYRAFLVANDLLAPADGNEQFSDEELEEARLSNRLAAGIKRSDLYKQLERPAAGKEAGNA